jgi:hypothetical protein
VVLYKNPEKINLETKDLEILKTRKAEISKNLYYEIEDEGESERVRVRVRKHFRVLDFQFRYFFRDFYSNF